MVSELLDRPVAEGLSSDDWHSTVTTAALSVEATLSAQSGNFWLRYVSPSSRSIVQIGGLPASLSSVFSEMTRLLHLDENWDSYGAPRPDPASVRRALELACEVMTESTPPPSVVPTSRGCVQLEWHTRGIDLEVEFSNGSQIHGLFEDLRSGESWEADLTFDMRKLNAAIASLSRRC